MTLDIFKNFCLHSTKYKIKLLNLNRGKLLTNNKNNDILQN